MNKQSDQKGFRRLRLRLHLPQWIGGEWVFQGLVTILVLPAAIHALLSLGGAGPVA